MSFLLLRCQAAFLLQTPRDIAGGAGFSGEEAVSGWDEEEGEERGDAERREL